MSTKTPSVCVGCRFADWDRTVKGALHAKGGGRCRWQASVALPYAMNGLWWLPTKAIDSRMLTLEGGLISRTKSEHRPVETCATKEPGDFIRPEGKVTPVDGGEAP